MIIGYSAINFVIQRCHHAQIYADKVVLQNVNKIEPRLKKGYQNYETLA